MKSAVSQGLAPKQARFQTLFDVKVTPDSNCSGVYTEGMNTRLIQTGVFVCSLSLCLGGASPLAATTLSSSTPKEHPTEKDFLKKFMPQALRGITPGKTSTAEVQKRLGDPAEKTKTQSTSGETVWRYELRGVRFDTSIRMSDQTGKVLAFSFLLGKDTPRLEEAQVLFAKQEWEFALSESKKRKASSEENPPLELRFPKSKLNLVFESYSPHTLRMVEFH